MAYQFIFRACKKDEIGGWIVTEEFRTDDAVKGKSDLMATLIEYAGEKILLEQYQFNNGTYSRVKMVEAVVILPNDINLNIL